MQEVSPASPEAALPPNWVPEAVSRVAAQLLRDSGPWSRCAINRLYRDPRMQTVWAEIGKSKRTSYKKTAKPFHVAQQFAEISQDKFVRMCQKNSEHWHTIGNHERGNLSDEDARVFRALTPQQYAYILVFMLGVSAAYPGFRVITEAEWAMQMGNRPAPPTFIIKRQRGDQAQKGMAVGIGSALRDLFGTSFIRTTATLVGVITGTRAPPPGRVREWLRNP